MGGVQLTGVHCCGTGSQRDGHAVRHAGRRIPRSHLHPRLLVDARGQFQQQAFESQRSQCVCDACRV